MNTRARADVTKPVKYVSVRVCIRIYVCTYNNKNNIYHITAGTHIMRARGLIIIIGRFYNDKSIKSLILYAKYAYIHNIIPYYGDMFTSAF